jgi:hypothetical protein
MVKESIIRKHLLPGYLLGIQFLMDDKWDVLGWTDIDGCSDHF